MGWTPGGGSGGASAPPYSVKQGSGFYYSPVAPGGLSASQFTLANLLAVPIWLPAGCTLSKIGIESSVAGVTNNARLGIYSDAGQYPGALLLDAGTVATNGVGANEIAIAQLIPASGLYWLAYASQGGTGATVRTLLNSFGAAPMVTTFAVSPAFTNVGCYFVAGGAPGALPNPFGAPPLSITGQGPRVYVAVL